MFRWVLYFFIVAGLSTHHAYSKPATKVYQRPRVLYFSHPCIDIFLISLELLFSRLSVPLPWMGGIQNPQFLFLPYFSNFNPSIRLGIKSNRAMSNFSSDSFDTKVNWSHQKKEHTESGVFDRCKLHHSMKNEMTHPVLGWHEVFQSQFGSPQIIDVSIVPVQKLSSVKTFNSNQFPFGKGHESKASSINEGFEQHAQWSIPKMFIAMDSFWKCQFELGGTPQHQNYSHFPLGASYSYVVSLYADWFGVNTRRFLQQGLHKLCLVFQAHGKCTSIRNLINFCASCSLCCNQKYLWTNQTFPTVSCWFDQTQSVVLWQDGLCKKGKQPMMYRLLNESCQSQGKSVLPKSISMTLAAFQDWW